MNPFVFEEIDRWFDGLRLLVSRPIGSLTFVELRDSLESGVKSYYRVYAAHRQGAYMETFDVVGVSTDRLITKKETSNGFSVFCDLYFYDLNLLDGGGNVSYVFTSEKSALEYISYLQKVIDEHGNTL